MEPTVTMNDNLRSFLDRDFIMPAHSINGLEGNLVSRYLYGTGEGGSRSYYKDVISLVLTQLGDKKGVSFDTFPNRAGETALGRYYDNANKILLNEVIASNAPLAYPTQILAHETFHKHLSEKNISAKYMGANQRNYVEGHHPSLARILGFTNEGFYYRLNHDEKQAYAYNEAFINSFLSQAYSLATFMKDPEKQQFVLDEKKFIDSKNAAIRNQIATAENNFIAKVLPTFYDRANTTFNSLSTFFLDCQVNSREEVMRDYPRLISRLEKVYPKGKASPYTAVFAMAEILGACPQNEKIDTFVDLMTTSRIDVGGALADILVRSRVPLTQNDFTRLAISTHNANMGMPELFSTEALDKIDEAVWAKNLVASVGPQVARETVADLKMSGKLPNTNFNAVESVLAKCSDKPLLNIGGVDVYSCRELLQIISHRESSNYERFSNNLVYFQTCGALSKNLASIINHFDVPTADNEEFVTALQNFVQNPRAMQFPEKETRNEVGILYSPVVSEKIAEYVGEVRAQGTQNNPMETEFTPTDSNGTSYTVLLDKSASDLGKSIAELSKQMQNLAQVINNIDVSTLIARLGLDPNITTTNNQNGEQTVHIASGANVEGEQPEPEITVSVRNSGKDAVVLAQDSPEPDNQFVDPLLEGQTDDAQEVMLEGLETKFNVIPQQVSGVAESLIAENGPIAEVTPVPEVAPVAEVAPIDIVPEQ